MENSRFHKKMFADEELICYTENGKENNVDWKICLSDTAVHNAVKFYLLNQWRPNNGLHGSITRRTPEYLTSNDNPRLVSRIDQYGTSTTVHRN